MIELRQTDLDEITMYAKKCLPNEACGLLAGEVKYPEASYGVFDPRGIHQMQEKSVPALGSLLAEEVKYPEASYGVFDSCGIRQMQEKSVPALGSLLAEIKDTVRIRKIYYLANIDESREHFSMDPKEQLAAIKDMRASGLTPLGNFHSHPETPARMSEEDKRLAYDKKAIYMILSLMYEPPVIKAFRFQGNEFLEEAIKII